MRLSRRVALGCIAASLLPAMAHAADPAASVPVEALNQGVMAAMRAGKNTPFLARFNALAPVIDRAFDLPGVLAASVGPRFATLPADQQANLLDAFRKFTVASYVSNFDVDDGSRIELAGEQRTVGADLVVPTRIVPKSGDPVTLDYVMRRGPQGWRAVDVLLNGSISQNAVKRSDFRSLVTATSAQPLIDSLRRKVSELSGGALS